MFPVLRRVGQLAQHLSPPSSVPGPFSTSIFRSFSIPAPPFPAARNMAVSYFAHYHNLLAKIDMSLRQETLAKSPIGWFQPTNLESSSVKCRSSETGSPGNLELSSHLRKTDTTSMSPTPALGVRFLPLAFNKNWELTLAAHRTLITRKLKGLEDIITYTSVHWHLGPQGEKLDSNFNPN